MSLCYSLLDTHRHLWTTNKLISLMNGILRKLDVTDSTRLDYLIGRLDTLLQHMHSSLAALPDRLCRIMTVLDNI